MAKNQIDKQERIQAIDELDQAIAKHQKTISVLVITEAIVCAFALAVGLLSVVASLTGQADLAAQDTGITSDMLGGQSAGGLMLFAGGLLVLMALTGFLAVILGRKALSDTTYSSGFTAMSFVTLVLSVVVLVVSIINGSFITNLSVIVINIFFSLSCVRTGLKLHNMHLKRITL